jgi:Asp-tRNA(Asn)/Glu-tRNA(Gln) amidotransferase A subunit family amidase
MSSHARPLQDVHALDATVARACIDDGRLTPSSLVAACLARIVARDRLIGAWAHVAPELARRRAALLDREACHGPLHGIPVGIKDVLDTFDMPTAHGSTLYRGDVPARDSACVAALRAAGAVIVGKTTTTAFASPIAVGVRNPLDFTRTAGVSSSGSAAAVADGHVPIALGTQTGGSVIRPASYCGIVGYKADIDAFDRGGIRHVRPSLDALGIFARSIDDIALVRRALTADAGGTPAGLPTRRGGAPQLALCRTTDWPRAHPATRAAIDAAVAGLRDAGATVTEIVLPPPFEHALEAFTTIVVHETAATMAREIADGAVALNAWLQGIAAKARAIGDAQLHVAQQVAAQCRARLAGMLADCDAIITPAAAGEAPADLHAAADPAFTALWTLLQGPCLSLPVLTGPNALPVGLQVVGARRADDALLCTSAWIVDALQPSGQRGVRGRAPPPPPVPPLSLINK